MGINIGDVIYDEARIYGDGINIAARLESIAEPGGIYVSRQAYEQIEGKLAISFRKLGPQTLKNIVKPVEVFAVEGIGGGGRRRQDRSGTAETGDQVLPVGRWRAPRLWDRRQRAAAGQGRELHEPPRI